MFLNVIFDLGESVDLKISREEEIWYVGIFLNLLKLKGI